jgi:hypothetical protein
VTVRSPVTARLSALTWGWTHGGERGTIRRYRAHPSARVITSAYYNGGAPRKGIRYRVHTLTTSSLADAPLHGKNVALGLDTVRTDVRDIERGYLRLALAIFGSAYCYRAVSLGTWARCPHHACSTCFRPTAERIVLHVRTDGADRLESLGVALVHP